MQIKKIKVVTVGHSGVGKTSIINKFVFQNADLSMIQPTLGAVYHQKVHLRQNGEKVTLEIWDTAGQQRYRSIAKIYYKDAKVVIAVYDVTCETSFEQLKHWIDEVRTHGSKNVKIVVVGNKVDMIDDKLESNEGQVHFEIAKKYCHSIGSSLKFTSAINSKGIEELFTFVEDLGLQAVVEVEKQVQVRKVQLNQAKKQREQRKSKCCL